MAGALYDCLIVGGGPAGLSAAIYLARFQRRAVVIDSDAGRSSGPQINDNYLGFPRGVKASRLRALGRRQAERFGACFVSGQLSSAVQREGCFALSGDCGDWRARTVVIATGVTDIWPPVPRVDRYVGRSLFWCITCDGFRARGKRTVLIGADDEATTTACQFLVYTKKLTFVATGIDGEVQITPPRLQVLRDHGIDVVEGDIERIEGTRGVVQRVIVNGEPYAADLIFSLLGAVPNSGLAAQLGVLLDDAGYIKIDAEQRTSATGVYAAGDVTGPYAHQVASAVHEGAMAAQAANYQLYEAYQQD
jgi:thioredoxin reductase (NADPH)